ncbi:LytTR family transcriptional regulator [Clostridia bacterium OttesenSCG-928-O13]|nr:LytTR family transcriptional regulator [Clostridia bacterium OttesenSCG-928-O13]
MKISINEHESFSETEIVINCRRADEQILRIVAGLRANDKKITGLCNGQTFLLGIQDIFYIDTADRKTFLYTAAQVYETPLRLYELEERLAPEDFFRATKSSVVNFAKIISLRPEFGGRMLVTLENGEKLTVSRQYVPFIKQKLRIEDK